MSNVGFHGSKTLSRWMTGALITATVALLGSCAGSGGGISGTGVQQTVVSGTVTGFGSVAVNGVHYAATPGAVVAVEGKGAATESDLAIGMNVVLRGSFDSAKGTGSYESIEYSSDLTGPVQTVDTVAGTVTLFGQTVQVDAATVLDGFVDLPALPSGALIQVSGVLSGAGVLKATRLFLVKPVALPSDEVKLKGAVSSTAVGSFTIGTQQITYTVGQTEFERVLPSELSSADSRLIEVRGLLNGGVIVASHVERREAISGSGRIEIEGVVQSGDVHSFLLNTVAGPVTVAGDGATIVEGTAAAIQAGVTVEVVGTIANGVLQASAIEVERPNSVKLEGDVSAVDVPARTLTVNGTLVVITDGTILKDSSTARIRKFTLANLAVGDHVQVAGAVDTTVTPNRVLANKLERLEPSTSTVTQGLND